MKKTIFIICIVAILSGSVGFFIPSPFTTILRVVFLITADMLFILLLAKLLFAGSKVIKKRNSKNRLKMS
ncbi:MAG: hypothetical protein ACSHWW_07415 [Nonlabens sp.]|uniref:hypothetical protein n=1 Tax=Nonlabens sp. TaxID=1888209 RepID=UPI003EF7D6D7